MIGHKISRYQYIPKLLFQCLEKRGVKLAAVPLTFSFLMQQLRIVSTGAMLDADHSLHYQQERMSRLVLQDVGLIKAPLDVDQAGITPKGLMTLKLYDEGWLKPLR